MALAEKLNLRVMTNLKMAAAFPTDHRLHVGPSGNRLSAGPGFPGGAWTAAAVGEPGGAIALLLDRWNRLYPPYAIESWDP